ncbi:DUF3750 domain-containing protein [Sinorhizobium meliloti]|jgi:hypothetical protein|uniref:DUF3750 domain-containing protein n=1 Tax=Rhizobium meliloti TaxID=382 RepID=UPI0002861494|nr:DUF3750 domain-containing protein [Sinorhizobium meliloti]ASP79521.1 DUF3750 domain-containing protein [Sinorhizobium meliloti]KKA15683.1 hypothetical protein VP03_00120 [Sinorhizobium meliloti]MQW19708.1 DUF3750 domain-containing protein [Sinorhizobium meliloti]QGJ73430.1 DUF3750 domain-containing protein [Sinorhizobium meliloti]QND26126.1 DUF3750 domain-containing protein [Sinorhizobium meliloti]
MKFLRKLFLVFAAVYLLPALASAGLWYLKERPQSWHDADWSSSGILADAAASPQAAIYVFSATTGGMKGAVASHAWIVTKDEGASTYNRYEKVGWGKPIRRNAYPADGRWYSNEPRIVVAVRGEEAKRLIPKIEKAIEAYPYSSPGAYRLWPGPNSNTFVAHVLRSVPELDAVLPPDAVGRDYLPEGKLFHVDADGRDLHATLYGLAGVSAGWRSGLELHFMGLVAGFDVARPGVKIPALGRFGI